MSAPRFSIDEIHCYERPVRLRLPFRFGAVTVTHAPQAFIRARIRLSDGREASGMSAELMVPKWFDKSPQLTQEQSFDQLRRSLALARDAYVQPQVQRTAFGHFAAHYAELQQQGAAATLPALAAAFGGAELDEAVLDALCRALGTSFYDVLRRNAAGIAPAGLLPEFGDFDFDGFLAALAPEPSIAVRHTVGMLDAIDGDPHVADDGLPESLAQAIAVYGLRYFKLKLGGDVAMDVARLSAIAALLNRTVEDYTVTLDGNEQYDDLVSLQVLWDELRSTDALTRLRSRVAFVEQPVRRDRALSHDINGADVDVPLIIDESDGTLDAFVTARALGYAGVSTKACKGLYKSLVNRARCERWNAAAGRPIWFMSAEDLTTQAGLGVQQDVALVSLLGIRHVERNGHHYVNGFAGQGAPDVEQDAFLAWHDDLYTRSHGSVRLRVERGTLSIASLGGIGYASGAYPEDSSLVEMTASGQ